VKTVVLGPRPAELKQLIERRQALGRDTFDEVWEGEYHIAAAVHFRHAYLDNAVAALLRPYAEAAGVIGSGPFNLGQEDDFRVPDRGLHREMVDAVYLDTAAMVVEIVSPDDETCEKFRFYADHAVEEDPVVEPEARRVRIFALEAAPTRRPNAAPCSELTLGRSPKRSRGLEFGVQLQQHDNALVAGEACSPVRKGTWAHDEALERGRPGGAGTAGGRDHAVGAGQRGRDRCRRSG
jgi:hypothetical protein